MTLNGNLSQARPTHSWRALSFVGVISGSLGFAVAWHMKGSPEKAAPCLPPEPTPEEYGNPTAHDPSPEPTAEPAPIRELERIALTQALSSFRAKCWDTSTAIGGYAGESLAKFSLLIRAEEAGPKLFDFCIEELSFDGRSVSWGQNGLASASSPYGPAAGWFLYSDRVTQWVRPANGRNFMGHVAAGSPVCVRGTVAQVLNQDYGTFWGAAVSFAFVQPSPGSGQDVLYKPDFKQVTVVLSGRTIPKGLRLTIDNDMSDGNSTTWCVNVR